VSIEPASPITTYFRVCDGVRLRYADTKADSHTVVLMLAPWPESLWAFRRIWDRVRPLGRVVALDMPGFGHSDQQRPELIAPDAMGEFLARLIDEWRLGAPHIVGPDVGTAAALFLAAKAPERVTSLTIGGGAVRFPVEAGGALKNVIEAPSLDVAVIAFFFAPGLYPEPATSPSRTSIHAARWLANLKPSAAWRPAKSAMTSGGAGHHSGRPPAVNPAFISPDTASDGIHETLVTEDSIRMSAPRRVRLTFKAVELR
jgi:pimeloyl-ACP methyl ester carboxylesterase